MKEKIVNFLKIVILFFAMGMGFFATYALVWVYLRLPIYWWTPWICITFAIGATWGFVKWVESGQ